MYDYCKDQIIGIINCAEHIDHRCNRYSIIRRQGVTDVYTISYRHYLRQETVKNTRHHSKHE